ncbi:TatD family hydrolase [Cellulomonas rhizosphaerae]|uniref:TatD family deoxyribonuclease n=1 Tax=Cellulomonas rhizosphaerae TaxID=2293719 RepID=A0A413RQR2_9CELL|nr:TatD family hydrolase [Cellulomonas rhizosphaerae]RHA44283.1 TatD family deoxyribonuclease [Cellulomonas rhizosphaerae]
MARSRERGWPAPPEPLPAPVVDNHTHLDSVVEWVADGWEPGAPAGTTTVEQQLERAAAVGVERMVQVGCDLDAVRWTDRVVRDHAQLLGAVAIHPNEAVLHAGVHEVAPDGLEPDPQPRHAASLDDAIDAVMQTARANPRIRAIGETGLDYFRAGPRGRAVQRDAFRAHIALAKELGLALQIHDRDAHDDVVDILLNDGAPERTVFHCFSGGPALAQVARENGWFASFAGPVSFGANDDLRAALRELPLELVLVETDAPYLTVHPFRGRPNAPYLLPGTVRTVADELGLDLESACRKIAWNSEAVYGPW